MSAAEQSLQERLREVLGDLLDGVELVCTGPCPPYSFA